MDVKVIIFLDSLALIANFYLACADNALRDLGIFGVLIFSGHIYDDYRKLKKQKENGKLL